MRWTFFALIACAFQLRSRANPTAVDAATGSQEAAKNAASAADAAKSSAKILTSVHHDTSAMKEMLQSMLVANSQQMFALNNVQQATRELKRGYEAYQEDVRKCHRELADVKSTSLEALHDEQLADSVAYPSFVQASLATAGHAEAVMIDEVDSLARSLRDARDMLKTFAAML
eukprot:GEMP01095254.1.p1 GENE.GEMP01095254.1~~GEMP01095254.1.p1  ORF type:complete len:173 (+),score=52.98 GEMP01095254.1:115-633(+)